LKLAELDGENWFDDDEPLTADEKGAARLASYQNDPESDSTWEEVETRIRARLTRQPTS
jgi:hypothetical protein